MAARKALRSGALVAALLVIADLGVRFPSVTTTTRWIPPSPWRSRVFWLIVGVAVTCVAGGISVYWPEIVSALTGRQFHFDYQPSWLRRLQTVIGYASWIVGGVLLVARLLGRRRIRVAWYALGGVLTYAGLLGSLLARPALQQWRNEIAFGSVTWRANPRSANPMWPTRLRMVDDLMARRLLDGVSLDSVTALLGTPDSTAYFSDWSMVYYLGPERGLVSIDSEWLVIRLGPEGMVREYRLARDLSWSGGWLNRSRVAARPRSPRPGSARTPASSSLQ